MLSNCTYLLAHVGLCQSKKAVCSGVNTFQKTVNLNSPGMQTSGNGGFAIVYQQPDGTEQKNVVGLKKCIHFYFIFSSRFFFVVFSLVSPHQSVLIKQQTTNNKNNKQQKRYQDQLQATQQYSKSFVFSQVHSQKAPTYRLTHLYTLTLVLTISL